ncbi:MAG: NlpC/P60 family protein [Pseudomonadota bacterium]
MKDRRLYPANERVAHESLRGQVDGVEYVHWRKSYVSMPVADLLEAPCGSRDRQVLYGQLVHVLETYNGWSFVSCYPNSYVGYVRAEHLVDHRQATHWVTARATHLYSERNFKSDDLMLLPFGSSVVVIGASEKYLETPDGYVPKRHVQETSKLFEDPVDVADLHLGAPYLWGGDSVLGIDCSGLVQIACRACAIPCPGDSDMQEAELGDHLADDAPLQRGDLLFWKGHVALVADPTTIIHANAFHMAVSYEPIDVAISRIEAQGDGPVTSRKRLEQFA